MLVCTCIFIFLLKVVLLILCLASLMLSLSFSFKVSWLACWVENIQGSYKYVMLNPTSRLKVRLKCCFSVLFWKESVHYTVCCTN